MKKTTTTRGRAQDRSKIAGGQDYEIQYESRKTGESTNAIKDIIKTTGKNGRKKIEAIIDKGKNKA